MTGLLEAVCVVHALKPSPNGAVTAIDKRPVEGTSRIRRHGVWGDVQGDRENHGGRFQAVYAFSAETREDWAGRLGRDLGPGAFGENLVTRGVDADAAVIGEQWRIGSVLLEVTAPRTPCATFEEHMGITGWMRDVTRDGRTGCYLRVLEPGSVRPGDGIETTRPEHGVTVHDVFTGPDAEQAHTLLNWATGQRTDLHARVLEKCERALRAAPPAVGARA